MVAQPTEPTTTDTPRATPADRYNLAAVARRARKTHWCDEDWAHDREIRPGALYVRTACFPGHDGNPDGRQPWVMKLCAHCASLYPVSNDALKAAACEPS